jgi:hypothetical protein
MTPKGDYPMPEPIDNYLQNALVAVQKLDKNLRLLRNRGDATEAEVSLAKESIASLRKIAHIRGIKPTDIDSRGERAR